MTLRAMSRRRSRAVDEDPAREIGVDFENAETAVIRSAIGNEYRPRVDVRIRIAGQTLDTKATVAEREGMDNQVLVERQDLRGFLIRVGGDREDTPPRGLRRRRWPC